MGGTVTVRDLIARVADAAEAASAKLMDSFFQHGRITEIDLVALEISYWLDKVARLGRKMTT